MIEPFLKFFNFFHSIQRLNSVLDESNKNCAAGSSEENRNKNRSDSVIPYDRNRVILAPVGMFKMDSVLFRFKKF